MSTKVNIREEDKHIRIQPEVFTRLEAAYSEFSAAYEMLIEAGVKLNTAKSICRQYCDIAIQSVNKEQQRKADEAREANKRTGSIF